MTEESPGVHVACPHCGITLKVTHSMTAGEYDCGKCGRAITLLWSLYKTGGGRKPNLLIMESDKEKAQP